MNSVVIGNTGIRPVTYGLALYFFLIATDCFPLGAVGSLLKIFALIPVGLSLLEIRQMRIRFDPLIVFQFLFLILAVLSLFYSVDQSSTVAVVITLSLNLVLVFSLGSMLSYSETEVNFLFKAMLYGSWLTVVLMLVFSNVSHDGRLTLQLGEGAQDQNYINGYILFAFSYHCKSAFWDRKWKHGILVLLLFVIVLLTGSRGALLAYITVALVHLFRMVINTGKAVRNLLLLIAIVLVALIAFEAVLNQLPADIAQRFSWDFIMETGTTGRIRIWKDLWNHFCDGSMFRMLFGHGYGTTITVSIQGKVAHNLYLDNLITLGVFGLLLQILTQICVLREMVRQKELVLLGTYVGFLVMCLSLSLTAYKPIWNIMMITMIMRYSVQNNGNVLQKIQEVAR